MTDKSEDSTRPVIYTANRPSQSISSFSESTVAGLSPVLSAGSAMVDLVPHDNIGLHNIIHFRLGVAGYARGRSRWFLGRFWNRVTGESPNFIPLSGTHLRQVLAVIGVNTPSFVAPSGQYMLRCDVANEAKAILYKTIKG